jgi:hypothetical protein
MWFAYASVADSPKKIKVRVSHISRKTSEIWATRRFLPGRDGRKKERPRLLAAFDGFGGLKAVNGIALAIGDRDVGEDDAGSAVESVFGLLWRGRLRVDESGDGDQRKSNGKE